MGLHSLVHRVTLYASDGTTYKVEDVEKKHVFLDGKLLTELSAVEHVILQNQKDSTRVTFGGTTNGSKNRPLAEVEAMSTTPVAKRPEPESMWACRACTFAENKPDYLACDVCG